MKRVIISLLLVALLPIVASAAAQNPIDKGSIILGGTLGFTSQGGDLYKVDGNSLTTMTFSPSVGYFVAPSIMVGAEINYVHFKQGDAKATQWFLGPKAGYYFNASKARTEIKGSLYPYVEGFFMFGKDKEGDADASTLTRFGGRGGIDYMLTNSVAADFALTFASDGFKPKGGDKVSGSTIMFQVGIKAFIF